MNMDKDYWEPTGEYDSQPGPEPTYKSETTDVFYRVDVDQKIRIMSELINSGDYVTHGKIDDLLRDVNKIFKDLSK